MKKIVIRNILLMVSFVLIILSLSACSKNLDETKLELVKYGMSEKEVEEELGKPRETSSNVEQIKKELAQYATFKSIVPKKIGDAIDSQLVDNMDERLEEMQTTNSNLTIDTYDLGSDKSVLLLFEDGKLVSYIFIENEEEKVSIASMEFWCL